MADPLVVSLAYDFRHSRPLVFANTPLALEISCQLFCFHNNAPPGGQRQFANSLPAHYISDPLPLGLRLE